MQKKRESFYAPTVQRFSKTRILFEITKKKDDQQDPVVLVQQVLLLATPLAARKNEGKRVH